MNLETILFEKEAQIAHLTINRPQALNALNSKVFEELTEVLDVLEHDTELKILVITGSGKAFVAGADIAEMADKTPEQATEFSKYAQAIFNRIESLPQIVIAAINGFALGGGLELAMTADFRFASAKAKMGQPEVNLGLIPGFAGSVRLPRLVGLADALYLLTTSEMIDAQEALRLRLVQKVFAPEELLSETMKVANLILQKGPEAVQKVKWLVRNAYNMNYYAAQNLEAEQFGTCFNAQGKEGMSAFLEKRKANF